VRPPAPQACREPAPLCLQYRCSPVPFCAFKPQVDLSFALLVDHPPSRPASHGLVDITLRSARSSESRRMFNFLRPCSVSTMRSAHSATIFSTSVGLLRRVAAPTAPAAISGYGRGKGRGISESMNTLSNFYDTTALRPRPLRRAPRKPRRGWLPAGSPGRRPWTRGSLPPLPAWRGMALVIEHGKATTACGERPCGGTARLPHPHARHADVHGHDVGAQRSNHLQRTRPSAASPTTSMSGCCRSWRARPARTTAWSSPGGRGSFVPRAAPRELSAGGRPARPRSAPRVHRRRRDPDRDAGAPSRRAFHVDPPPVSASLSRMLNRPMPLLPLPAFPLPKSLPPRRVESAALIRHGD